MGDRKIKQGVTEKRKLMLKKASELFDQPSDVHKAALEMDEAFDKSAHIHKAALLDINKRQHNIMRNIPSKGLRAIKSMKHIDTFHKKAQLLELLSCSLDDLSDAFDILEQLDSGEYELKELRRVCTALEVICPKILASVAEVDEVYENTDADII